MLYQEQHGTPLRVLYSFPHKLGADRICYTAWEQVRGLAGAGAQVLAMPGVLHRPVPDGVTVEATLSRGRYRIPYKLLGATNACRLHDHIVARRLERMAGRIDIVHCWPRGALATLKVAKKLGIPTVLERPNAHTRFCYRAVAKECQRIGIETAHRDYEPDSRALDLEEREFASTDYLLCPSDFTAKSFLDEGFPTSKILRHTYGFDENLYFPDTMRRQQEKKFIAIFVGVDAVRKGLHIALDAWLLSPAIKDGIFFIAGELSPEYKKRFAWELSDPSVVQLGHRRDVPDLMRKADVLLMPSIEEGFGLVCVDALGCGVVPLVSKACTETCRHMDNALVHEVGDLQSLREHITMLYENGQLLNRLREGALRSRYDLTWTVAGRRLLDVYQEALSSPGRVGGLVKAV
jgi:glycosyltransferase involved in cell wall biosynthesis